MKLGMTVGFLLLIGALYAGERDFANGLAIGLACGAFSLVVQWGYHREKDKRYRRFYL